MLGLNLDHYIKVEEVKNERGRVLFRFIRFNLNHKSLRTILRARFRKQQLYISKSLLSQLRYCVLFDGESQRRRSCFQSGLTLCTYYNTHAQTDTIVMRSVVSLDGDIIHQIRRDSFEYPKRCRAIAAAHYWMLEQLISRLGFQAIQLALNWLSWGISFAIVATAFIVYALNFTPVNPLMLLPAVLMWLLLQVLLKRLLRFLLPFLRRWTFRQLFFSLLSRNRLKKKIAKGVLTRFVQ